MPGQDRSDSQDREWDDERPRRRARRGTRRGKSPLGRLFGLVKLAVFLMPAARFLFGSLFADCRARPSFGDWTSMLGATACARQEMMGNALSMQDNFALLKRLID